jgi:hypothetical protein
MHPTISLSKTSSYGKDAREFFILSLYSKHFSTIASGATPIESAGRAPDEILDPKNNKEGKRWTTQRFSYSDVTPIGREFIFIKDGQLKDFQY